MCASDESRRKLSSVWISSRPASYQTSCIQHGRSFIAYVQYSTVVKCSETFSSLVAWYTLYEISSRWVNKSFSPHVWMKVWAMCAHSSHTGVYFKSCGLLAQAMSAGRNTERIQSYRMRHDLWSANKTFDGVQYDWELHEVRRCWLSSLRSTKNSSKHFQKFAAESSSLCA